MRPHNGQVRAPRTAGQGRREGSQAGHLVARFVPVILYSLFLGLGPYLTAARVSAAVLF
jgi:hypothetical protein